MVSRRLQRLASLTRGMALIGIGVSATGCKEDPPPTMNAPVTMNSPAPPDDAAAPPVASDAGVAAAPINMNGPMPTPTADDTAVAKDAGPTDGGFRHPPIINAPPRRPQPPPTTKP